MSIWTCGQAHASLDCGFFCSVVLLKMYRAGGDFINMNLAQSEVYRVRECFYSGRGKQDSWDLTASRRWLDADNLIEYFNFVGLGGYTLYRGGSVSDINSALKSSGGKGAMVAERGHWRAFLGEHDGHQWIYDPAPGVYLEKYQFYGALDGAQLLMLPT